MLKNIFSDVILLYKNFFFWFKIKFFAFVLGSFLGFVIALPSAILTLAYYWSIGSKEFYLLQISLEDLNNYYLLFLVFLNYFTFIIGFLYSYIFLIKFNLELSEKRKKFNFKILKNFFNKKNFTRFLNISIIFLCLFLSIGLFLSFIYSQILNIPQFKGSINLFFLTGETDGNIGILAFSIFPIIFGIIFLIYKIIFSFAFMIEEERCTIKSIKSSLKNTNFKKFIKTLFNLVMVLFPFLIINSFSNKIEKISGENIKEIIVFRDLKTKIKLSEEESKVLEVLNLKFFGANENDINKVYYYNLAILNIIKIFNFLFIYGAFSMIYTSIYKNIIKEKND